MLPDFRGRAPPGCRRGRHGGVDALGLGGDDGDGVVEGQRPIQHAAGDLAAVGHLGTKRGGIQRGALFWGDGFDGSEDRHLSVRLSPSTRARSMALRTMSALAFRGSGSMLIAASVMSMASCEVGTSARKTG